LVWLGLKRNGLTAEAETLRKKSRDLFAHSWQSRLAPENFNAKTGNGLDQPDTDPFYSWTVLLPLMSLAEVTDVDPWTGWCLRTTGEDTELGPINSSIGPVHLTRRRGWIEVRQAGKIILATNIAPAITHLEINDRMILMLPAGLGKGRKLRTAKTITSAIQNGRALPLASPGNDLRLRTTGSKPELLEVDFAG
jgi:putative isomerase